MAVPSAPTGFSITVASAVVVTTASLPSATANVAYSATLTASGGVTPYTWTILSGQDGQGFPAISMAGALSGTPTQSESLSLVVQVTDALGAVASKTLSLTVGASANAPAQIWAGPVDSSHAIVMAWPTPAGGDTGYFFYRNGVKVNSSPILPQVTIGGGSVAQPFLIDGLTTGLSPSTSYTYTATAVVNGIETAQSTSVVQTTLGGPTNVTGATPPAAATDPSTWVVGPPAIGSLSSVPAGNTVWIVNTTVNGAAGTSGPNPGGGTTVTGCGVDTAFAGALLTGGDVIAFDPAHGPYIRNFTLPVFTGANGFTFLTSTQAKEYAGLGGTLPAYSINTLDRFTTFTLTAGPTITADFWATISGTALTVTQLNSGAIAANAIVTGPMVQYGDKIVSGSGTSWVVSISQTIGGSFTGSISSTTLTAPSGTLIIPGELITGSGVTAGTTVIQKLTATTWQVSISQTVSSTTLTFSRRMTTGGATSATLISNFNGRTGYYPVMFQPSLVGSTLNETRNALFTNGSPNIQWNVPLINPATPTISANIGNFVTPWDCNAPGLPVANPSPSMPILQFPFGGGIATGIFEHTGTSKVRYIGIAVMPALNTTPFAATTNFACIAQDAGATPLESIYRDRCLFGYDTSRYLIDMPYVTHGVQTNCNHGLFHQCFTYGIVDGTNGNGLPGGDANGIGISGGGPGYIRNCYNESQAEHVVTGGQPIAQTNIPHDWVYQYNTLHKPTQWQMNGIGTGVKNHFEGKVGVRFQILDNLQINNWLGFASQGQNARGDVLGSRDQTAGWGPSNGLSITCAVTAVSGSTVTFTPSAGTSNPFFFNGLNNGYAWIQGAGGITPMVFKIQSTTSTPGAGNTFTMTSTIPFIGTYTSGGSLTPCDTACQGPWCNIQDWDIQRNAIYNAGTALYDFGNGDAAITGSTTRVRFSNNQFFGNPGTDINDFQPQPNAIQVFGTATDFTIQHNTLVINSNNFNYVHGSSFFSAGIAQVGPPVGTFPALVDRVYMADNVLDGNNALLSVPGSQIGGLAALNFSFSNSTFTNNAAPIDTQPFTGTATNGNFVGPHHAAVGYQNMGFANWNGVGTGSPISPPTDPSNWNITSGPLSTASTTGGAIGATMAPNSQALALDPFPRTSWQAATGLPISHFASATFQANAAKFNVVDVAPFVGQEGTGANTFLAIFKNIKALSAANGFATPTRCYHHVDSWVSSYPAWQSNISYAVGNGVTFITGGQENSYICNTANTNQQPTNTAFWTLLFAPSGRGAQDTFTQYGNFVNAANWWLRTTYPSGSIVNSTFSGETQQTGVLALTSDNNVLYQPQGSSAALTIAQGYAYHFDGFLRTGAGVAMGYAANVSFVANPFVDGYMFDNIFSQTRTAGSYTMNSTTQAVADATASTLNQQGQTAQVEAFGALNPNIQIMGNCDYFTVSVNNLAGAPHLSTLDPSQKGLFDIVYWQVVLGPLGIDGAGSFAQCMANLIAAEAQMSPTGTARFEQTGRQNGPAVNFTSTSQSSWVAADWQAARYGCAWCCLRNWHYSLNVNENYSPDFPYFMDEYLNQGGNYGWLRQPIDPPQSAARVQGVFYRVFQGGVVFCNPRGNGTQTINLTTLGLTGLKAIASLGFGDTSINTGLAVTSITLQASDGRFLKNF